MTSYPARFDTSACRGGIPATTLGGHIGIPAGVWFDVVTMPSVLAERVLRELSIAMLPATAIWDCRRQRTGILTAVSMDGVPAVPTDLCEALVSTVPRGILVPLPISTSGRYRWLRLPAEVGQSPPWSAVVGVARRALASALS